MLLFKCSISPADVASLAVKDIQNTHEQVWRLRSLQRTSIRREGYRGFGGERIISFALAYSTCDLIHDFATKSIQRVNLLRTLLQRYPGILLRRVDIGLCQPLVRVSELPVPARCQRGRGRDEDTGRERKTVTGLYT